MKPEESSKEPSLGAVLLARGCRQGALLDAPARTLWLRTHDEPNTAEWIIGDKAGEGQLVVVSQDCDVFAASETEPFVEAIAATWTTDRGEIFRARKGNSSRFFLVQEEKERGLIADARYRVQIQKEALVASQFAALFSSEEQRARFSRWVAGRYDRPAVANELVEAIHKPVVKAVGALKKLSPLFTILDRIGELRFSLAKDDVPYVVHFIGLLEDGDQLSPEEEAEFMGWLEGLLVREDGPVAEILVAFGTPKSISLHDYERTTRLQLDHFSPDCA